MTHARPEFQEGVLPPVISLTASSGVHPSRPGTSGMRHRRYSGRVDYLDAQRKQIGRELFTVTIQTDGVRTLRALCEMDDFRLLRDCTISVDAEWRPLDAFVRLMMEEKLVGTSWFYFDEHGAACEGYTVGEGRLSQHFTLTERARSFGAHPLHNDSWAVIRYRQQNVTGGNALSGMTFSTSFLSNGGSGPLLVPSQPGRAERSYLGHEKTETAAGTFNTEHMRVTFAAGDEMNIFAMGEDAIPCYQTHTWPDRPTKIFELVSLEGDYR